MGHLFGVFCKKKLFIFSPLESSSIFAYPLLQPLLALLMSSVLIHNTLPILFYYTSLSFNCSICSHVTLFYFTGVLDSNHSTVYSVTVTLITTAWLTRGTGSSVFLTVCCFLVCCLTPSAFRSFSGEMRFRQPFSPFHANTPHKIHLVSCYYVL